MGELDGRLNEKSVFLFQKDDLHALRNHLGFYRQRMHALGNEQKEGKSLGQLLEPTTVASTCASPIVHNTAPVA